jgi:hypothetical protein
MSQEIQLSRGLVAIVDDCDYERLSGFKWYASLEGKRFYAVHGRKQKIRMHRLILYAPRGKEVDHINGNTLDNRRGNLRLATRAQNGRNRRISRTNTSGFKGVHLHKRTGRWNAQIKFRGKIYNLGCFDTPEEAAREYDRAARLAFGKFSRLNFALISPACQTPQ